MLVFPTPTTGLVLTQRVNSAIPVALKVFFHHLGFRRQAINVSRSQGPRLIKLIQIAVNTIGKTERVGKIAYGFKLIADTTADDDICSTFKRAMLPFISTLVISHAIDVDRLRWCKSA